MSGGQDDRFCSTGMFLSTSVQDPSPSYRAEREGPAKREGEVGGAATGSSAPLTLPSPPGQRGERVIKRRFAGKFCWCSVAALVAAAVWALPAAAQQAIGGGPVLLTLPPFPTDAGKPVIFSPGFIAKSDEDKSCAPGFSCRLRLLGVIQNNGAVELRATAFTW